MTYISFYLLIFGYYLIAPLAFAVGAQSPLFSLSLRVLFFVIFLWSIRSQKLTIRLNSIFIIFFLIAINLLLLHNLFVVSYPTNDSPDSFYLYHLIVVLPTCVLVSLLNINSLNYRGFIETGARYFLVVAILNTACGLVTIISDPVLLLSGRFQHTNLNPISMGFMFATGVVFWVIKIQGCERLKLKYLVVLFFLAVGLLLSNSRSALLGVLMVIFYMNLIRITKFRDFKVVYISTIGMCIIFSFLYFYVGINPFGRLLSITSSTELSVTSRLDVWNDAFLSLANSPVIPLKLVTEQGGFPHNIFVELLSGFGLILGPLIILVLFIPFCRLYNNKFMNLFILLYILYFMRAITSGGLYQLSELFSMLLLLLTNVHVLNTNETNR